MNKWILYVLALFSLAGCSLDANVEDLTSRQKSRLHLVFDDAYRTINSTNVRLYQVRGTCENVGQPVDITLEGFGVYETTCTEDRSFSVNIDLVGIAEGSYKISASQQEQDATKVSLDNHVIEVDLTPPTVTINPPDSEDNYSASLFRANYPINGTCSDSLNLVKVTSSLQGEHFLVCSATNQWELRLNLSAETASSIDFYVQHFDKAGNVSETKVITIRYPQWQKISPEIQSTGFAAVRQIAPYGNSGRILLSSPLRNDDLVDLGIVNFDGTGLQRISPISGQWGLDTSLPITAIPKHNRALYVRFSMARVQLKELRTVKLDGSGDRLLMGPTTENPVGGVTRYALTSNENTVIAMGDVEATDNEFNLYAIDILTGNRTKLNGSMVNGGDVRDFLITPGGGTIVFRMDKDIDEAIDLYAVNVDGTGLRRLNTAMTAGNSVMSDYIISPDGKWVAYRENQSFRNIGTGLSLVSLVTGETIDMNGTMFTGFAINGLFSPNSRYFAMKTDRSISTCYELYVYDLLGRSESKLGINCSGSANDLGTYVWAPDSAKIAFSQSQSIGRYDLFVSAPDGSGLLRLTSATANRNGLYQGYKDRTILFTPDSKKVIFQADLSGVTPSSIGDMRYSLYATNVDGTGSLVNLTPAAPTSVVRDFPVIEVSPSGDRVVFIADLETDGKYEMYLAAANGASLRKLNPAIANVDGDVLTTTLSYFFDWDRSAVTMLVDDTIEAVNGIYVSSLNVAVSAPRKISLAQVMSGDYFMAAVARNKSKVLFRGNPEVDAEMHLYAADANGTNVRRVTKNYPAGGGKTTMYSLTDDGSKAIYVADQDTVGISELYVSDTTTGTVTKVSVPITHAQGSVVSYRFNETTQKLFYMVDPTTDNVFDIYSVNLDGTGSVKITPSYSHGVSMSLWEVAPSGAYVVIRWDYRVDEKFEIDKLTADGSGSPVAVNSAIGSLDLTNFRISPDSNWICYWGETAVARRIDVKVASASDPAGVNYMAAQGLDTVQMASSCQFTDDSEYLIIPGDWVVDGRTTIKTFRISDQSLFVMNPGLPSTSHTSFYQDLQEGANKRLITLSESSPDVYEIYSMNLDGTDLRKISATPYPGGQVNANYGTPVKIMDDASRTIVYTGLIEALGKWDLFAVKWDGTQARKLINLSSYADIYDTYQVPGVERVFFRSDEGRDGVLSLYSVKPDGTGLKNHTPGLKGATGAWGSITASSTHVFFNSDAYNSQILEIFADPL